MNKELKEMGKQLKEILDKYPNRQKEILFYIFGENTIREIIKKPTYEELEQKVNQLETNRDEAIELINKDRNKDYGSLEKKSFYCSKTNKLLEILERGKE